MNPTPRFLAALATAVVVLTACRPAAPPAEPAAAPAPVETALSAGEHVWITSDGNEMPYVVTGGGDVAVVLVHCWLCDRTFWSAQVPELAKLYRTVTVDLPGHGQATAKRNIWSVDAYGEDVARLIEGLGLSKVVLVGHSMGGPVSLRAAAAARGRVLGIVAVDTLHDAEFEMAGERMDGILRGFEADFAGTCKQFVDQMFPEEGVEAIRDRVRDLGCVNEKSAIGVALMKDFGAIDMKKWFSEAGVPIRAVNAAAPNPTKIESNRKYADFDAVTMQGVGHYPQMTRPAEFNPLLLAAIAELVGGTPRR